MESFIHVPAYRNVAFIGMGVTVIQSAKHLMFLHPFRGERRSPVSIVWSPSVLSVNRI